MSEQEPKRKGGITLNLPKGGGAARAMDELEKLQGGDLPQSMSAMMLSAVAAQAAGEELTDLGLLIDDRIELLKHLRRVVEYQETACKELTKVIKRVTKLVEEKPEPKA